MVEAQVQSEDSNVDGTRRLLERILLAFVSDPEAVRIDTSTAGEATTFTVRLAPADIARVIGDDGRTIQALRMILGSVGLRRSQRFILEIEERPE